LARSSPGRGGEIRRQVNRGEKSSDFFVQPNEPFDIWRFMHTPTAFILSVTFVASSKGQNHAE
jgi:hypothetical protein